MGIDRCFYAERMFAQSASRMIADLASLDFRSGRWVRNHLLLASHRDHRR